MHSLTRKVNTRLLNRAGSLRVNRLRIWEDDDELPGITIYVIKKQIPNHPLQTLNPRVQTWH